MEFQSAISILSDASQAVDELARATNGAQCDLAVVFATHHYGPEFDDVLAELSRKLGARNLIGCTGDGIIGPDREVERAPAMVLWTARLPGVRILPFVLDQDDVTAFETADDWIERLGVRPEDKPSFVILPEPFSINVEACLAALDQVYPGSAVVGGMASGANEPGQNRLFLNDQPLRQGLVGLSLSGPIRVHSVVSQGCRPIGESFVVTRAEENVIYELRGRPALDVLRGVFTDAPAQDQELMQKGLHVGRVVDERLGKFSRGDFLIRNVMGVVDDSALAVNSLMRPGQTIQFHVRDSKTAEEDMNRLLADALGRMGAPPCGGLLFSCNGRGTHLFGKPHHDIGVVNQLAPSCKVAGFFAAGEIGPVGHRTFIHGFTSSLVLFEPAAAS
ncbi:FIST N domain protein [Phycisphaerae bacterium RAS2]|nr:FIST N domain protein [Phycisphaerae bacterium RAS2]